jgi:hypothetical protein
VLSQERRRGHKDRPRIIQDGNGVRMIPCRNLRLLLALVASLKLAHVGIISSWSNPPPITKRDNDFSLHIRRYLQDNVFVPPIELPWSDAKESFLEDCIGFLLSKSIVLDQRITNMEFASYLAEYCTTSETVCSGGVGLPTCEVTFESLNPRIRKVFILASCPVNNTAKDTTCVSAFEGMGGEFGLEASPSTFATIRDTVQSLCDESHSIMTVEGLLDQIYNLTIGTLSPTPLAILLPTNNLTIPSFFPSLGPTVDKIDPRPVGSKASSRPKPTTPAILGMISIVAGIVFCVAVIFSGGAKDLSYDLNGPAMFDVATQEADAKPDTIDVEYNRDGIEKLEEDEGDHTEVGDTSDTNRRTNILTTP